jgi:hypothetical protein
MTTFLSQAQIVGAKVSTEGSYAIGADTSGVPILGLVLTSATSVVAAGNNAYVKCRDGAGTVFYLAARTSAP